MIVLAELLCFLNKFLMMVIRQIEYDSYVHPTFFILILLNKKTSKTSTVEFNSNGSIYQWETGYAE
jgi:hypothetical protein